MNDDVVVELTWKLCRLIEERADQFQAFQEMFSNHMRDSTGGPLSHCFRKRERSAFMDSEI